MASADLDRNWVLELTSSFADVRANRIARNAVIATNVDAAAVSPTAMRTYHDTFSVSRPKTGEITNQRQTGRCWMFASFNVLRAATMELLDVENFEFSEAFGMFYDKLEKFNAGLTNVIATAGLDDDSREVQHIFDLAVDDGNYHPVALNIVAKWGIVPADAMPESACSKSSDEMNQQLKRLFHKSAWELRSFVRSGAPEAAVAKRKAEMIASCHQMLCVCLGEPPQRFDFEVAVGKDAKVDPALVIEVEGAPAKDRANAAKNDAEAAEGASSAAKEDDDKCRRLLRDRGLTPRDFAKRYVPVDLTGYVDLVFMPGKSRPFGHVFHPTLTDTVVGGQPIRWLNVTQEVLEDAAMASLRAGVPVEFSCDVGQELPRSNTDFKNILATDTMDYEALFDVDLSMDREDMIDARETELTHSMTLQGVQVEDDGRPSAWRVENSWGKDCGKDGYLVMSNDWFALYGGEVIVRREFVDADILEIWDTAPAEDVAPWAAIGRFLLG